MEILTENIPVYLIGINYIEQKKANALIFYDPETEQNVTINLDWDCPICGKRMEVKRDSACGNCLNDRSQCGNYAGYGY